MIQRHWTAITALMTLMLNATPAVAIERRPLQEVSTDELVQETQVSYESPNFGFAWWIPPEYWEALFTQSGQSAFNEDFLQDFRSVFVLAVVQADISAFGNFDFFSADEIAQGLEVSYVNSEGRTTRLTPIEPAANNDLALLLQFVQQPLQSALGGFGEGLTFFIYRDVSATNARLVSPYEPGELQISLSDRRGVRRPPQAIEFPLNSLFVPRICPNGKPAHVSWRYCPWDGTRLPE